MGVGSTEAPRKCPPINFVSVALFLLLKTHPLCRLQLGMLRLPSGVFTGLCHADLSAQLDGGGWSAVLIPEKIEHIPLCSRKATTLPLI